MTQDALIRELRRILEPVVEREGFDLVAVEVLGSTGRALLRVSIDATGDPQAGSQPRGISVGDCARMSRAISPVLDVEDPFPGAYELEVSSPGMERPIQRPKDFQRFVGFKAKIKLQPGPERRRYSGVLKGFEPGPDGDKVLVEVDGQVHALSLDTIERAHLDLDDEQYARLDGTAFQSPGSSGGMS